MGTFKFLARLLGFPQVEADTMTAQAQQQQPDSWSGDDTDNAKADASGISPSRNPDNVDPASLNLNKNPNRVEHQAISEAKPLSESGKDIGQVNAPIVSLHPTSNKKSDAPKEIKPFDNANRLLNHTGPKHDFRYPFLDMNIGQGFFVPVEQNSNVDKLIAHLHRAVNAFHKQTSVEEKDDNGDDVMESVTVLPKKRTQDGVIQLDSAGKPIVGANHTNRPKLIHMAQFVIKSAVQGDELAEGRKADSDGALVIRVA